MSRSSIGKGMSKLSNLSPIMVCHCDRNLGACWLRYGLLRNFVFGVEKVIVEMWFGTRCRRGKEINTAHRYGHA